MNDKNSLATLKMERPISYTHVGKYTAERRAVYRLSEGEKQLNDF